MTPRPQVIQYYKAFAKLITENNITVDLNYPAGFVLRMYYKQFDIFTAITNEELLHSDEAHVMLDAVKQLNHKLKECEALAKQQEYFNKMGAL